jgi:hypothetical protein
MVSGFGSKEIVPISYHGNAGAIKEILGLIFLLILIYIFIDITARKRKVKKGNEI